MTFRNAWLCRKKLKNIFSFWNSWTQINVWIPQTLIRMEIWKYLSFGGFFSSWKGGGRLCGFVVKLVAAKVIRQYMFFFTFFTLSYFLDNNLWNKNKKISYIKIMIIGQILHQSNTFEVVLTTQILLVLSVDPNNYQIRFSNEYFLDTFCVERL